MQPISDRDRPDYGYSNAQDTADADAAAIAESDAAPPNVTDDARPAPVASSPAAVAPATRDLTVPLTPEALLAYLESKLSSLDGAIKTRMDAQAKTAEQRQAMHNATAAMSRYEAKGDSSDTVKALRAELEKLTPGSPAHHVLETVIGRLAGKTMDADGQMKEVDNLRAATDDLTDGGEMNMFELQALMSQRQTSIQLATNMLGKLSDGTQAIVGKIGA